MKVSNQSLSRYAADRPVSGAYLLSKKPDVLVTLDVGDLATT